MSIRFSTLPATPMMAVEEIQDENGIWISSTLKVPRILYPRPVWIYLLKVKKQRAKIISAEIDVPLANGTVAT